MKLKYYLRGLGIGIVVTALIFTITSGEKEALSDAEIRERATQLGMVDASTLTLSTLVNPTAETDAAKEADVSKEESGASKPPKTTESSGEAENSETTENNDTSKVTETTESSGSKETTENGGTVETVETKESTDAAETKESTEAAGVTEGLATIIIGRGADSYSVSKDLETAGLIEDAREYDAYLCEEGYSRRISIGTYEIPLGTEKEEIAKIITGKR